MADSVSAVISVSPRASATRYIVQALFMTVLAIAATLGMIYDSSHPTEWAIFLVIAISQMANIPFVDIIQFVRDERQMV